MGHLSILSQRVQQALLKQPVLHQTVAPIGKFFKANTDSLTHSLTGSLAGHQAQDTAYQNIYREVMAIDHDTRSHEQAHQAAAGKLAGGINLNMQSVSVPMADGTVKTIQYANGGSVGLKLPSVPQGADKNTLQSVIADLKQAISGALAPAKPSSQDYRVAASANQRLSSLQQQLKQTADTHPNQLDQKAQMQSQTQTKSAGLNLFG